MARLLNTAGVFVTFLLGFWMQLHDLTHKMFLSFHRSDRQIISNERDTPIDVILPELPHEPKIEPPPPPPPVIPFVNNSMDVANQMTRSSRQTVHDFGGYSSLPLRALSENHPQHFSP